MPGEVDRRVDLLGHLILGAEDVGVVLRDEADTREPVQRAGELVPMQRRRLGIADRQLAVAPKLAAEEEHVTGAVHRLDAVGRAIVVARDEEHVFAELLPVPGGLPERLVVDQRRLHLGIATTRVLAPAHVFERVVDRHPLRMPERRPR